MLKKLAVCVLAVLGAMSPFTVNAQDPADAATFPNKTVRVVVPFPAGGASDIVARMVAQRLSEIWNNPVIVDNRPGASGSIGTEFVMKAPRDGYTILLGGPSTLSGPPAINPKIAYDPVKDFSHVTIVCTFPSVLAVNPAIASTLPELIAILKANPGKYNYASSGNGTTSHLIAELFKSMTGTNIGHVPYKGSAPGLNDVMAGHVAMSFDPINVVTPLVRSNRLRALGVTSPKRSPELPDVPAIGEVVPGFEADSWIAFLAPAGTPNAILQKISADTKRAVNSPDTAKKLRDLTLTPVGSTPEELLQVVRADLDKWKNIVRIANIRPD